MAEREPVTPLEFVSTIDREPKQYLLVVEGEDYCYEFYCDFDNTLIKLYPPPHNSYNHIWHEFQPDTVVELFEYEVGEQQIIEMMDMDFPTVNLPYPSLELEKGMFLITHQDAIKDIAAHNDTVPEEFYDDES